MRDAPSTTKPPSPCSPACTSTAGPADLAVIGADDIPTARLANPPLTTVCYDLHDAARHRAETIIAGLAGQTTRPAVISADPRVIQRSST
ncbi:substrate-binding domain-containing protein [Nonomuraea sp. NPDC003707]